MFIPNRKAGPSSVRIIPPTGISPTIARIRRAHNALIHYWCLYWPLERDLRRRYAHSKARGLMFRVTSSGGHDGCRHGLHDHGRHNGAG